MATKYKKTNRAQVKKLLYKGGPAEVKPIGAYTGEAQMKKLPLVTPKTSAGKAMMKKMSKPISSGSTGTDSTSGGGKLMMKKMSKPITAKNNGGGKLMMKKMRKKIDN